MKRALYPCIAFLMFAATTHGSTLDVHTMPEQTETRWISFENPKGEKGAGGMANKGAKGAAFKPLPAGETLVLLDYEGSGTVRRIWMTLRPNDPVMLRSLVLRCYWDGAETPAVEVPLGDFFGAIHGEMKRFSSALLQNPEGRSFNSYITMPFRTHGRITVTNDADRDLEQLFYEMDLTVNEPQPDNMLYLHAHWRRDPLTKLGEDFEILPRIEGKGRFLGTHIGILGHPDNKGWWGEGEVKVYLDGDTEWPTLVGTGTEDYVGTAYGQGEYFSRFQGSLTVEENPAKYAFYRHHVPDPVYFHQDIRVTIQQMGGAGKRTVEQLLEQGVEIQPISVHGEDEIHLLLEEGKTLDDPSLPDGWTNMYRRDDVSAVAMFYLDKAESGLPRIQPVGVRTKEMTR
jgi:hypothetical protein